MVEHVTFLHNAVALRKVSEQRAHHNAQYWAKHFVLKYPQLNETDNFCALYESDVPKWFELKSEASFDFEQEIKNIFTAFHK